MIPACKRADAANPRPDVPGSRLGSMRGPSKLFLVRFRLCDICYEPDVGKARRAQKPHDVGRDGRGCETERPTALACHLLIELTGEYGGKLVCKGVKPRGVTANFIDEAVVEDHRGYRGEQPHCRGK